MQKVLDIIQVRYKKKHIRFEHPFWLIISMLLAGLENN